MPQRIHDDIDFTFDPLTTCSTLRVTLTTRLEPSLWADIETTHVTLSLAPEKLHGTNGLTSEDNIFTITAEGSKNPRHTAGVAHSLLRALRELENQAQDPEHIEGQRSIVRLGGGDVALPAQTGRGEVTLPGALTTASALVAYADWKQYLQQAGETEIIGRLAETLVHMCESNPFATKEIAGEGSPSKAERI